MFDPEKVAKMFDPAQLSAALDPKQFQQVDVNALLETNKRNYESMVSANKAAASIYKSFYEKQMSIYTEVMGEAAVQIQALQSTGAPDLREQQSKIYDDAVKRSLQLMTDFATATQRANEDAFDVIKDRIKEVVVEMKPKK
jgi:hypothetical protein